MQDIPRRDFLKLAAGQAAAGFALAGKSTDRLISYVIPPEHVKPGEFTFFATTCRECPAGCGMHLWHRDGRVTKAEGNPEHPINGGVLCARGQSSLLGLYDPDRVRGVLQRRTDAGLQPGEWGTALSAIGDHIHRSAGRVILLSDLQAGALAEVMDAFSEAFGSGPPLLYEPFDYGPQRAAHDALFGVPAIPDYRIDRCDLVISFAADFLETWVSPVQLARHFGRMHSYRDGRVGRFVYVGPRLSVTAANADEFLQVPPGAERAVALAMLKAIVEKGWAKNDPGDLGRSAAALAGPVPGVEAARIEELARAFVEAEASVALPGPDAGAGPAARDTALAVGLLNYAAGRIGTTVDFARAHAIGNASSHEDVRRMLAGLSGEDVLIVHNANPAHTMPAAAADLRRAGLLVYLGTMLDETAAQADWVLPVDSPLESWGDYEPAVGVHSLMQPTMERLFDTRPAGDVLLAVAQAAGRPLAPEGAQEPVAGFKDWLRMRWEGLRARLAPQVEPEQFWQDALRRGGVWEAVEEGPPPGGLGQAAFGQTPEKDGSGDADLWLWPSILLYDGRTANRGWMQEIPEPISYVAWTGLVDIHPDVAGRLGIATDDVVELSNGQGTVQAPARVTEDVAPGVAALAFGQGHTQMGRNADGRGANAFALLGAGAFGRVSVRRTGRRASPSYEAATRDQHGRHEMQWVALSTVQKMKPGEGDHLIMPLPEGYDPHKDYLRAAHLPRAPLGDGRRPAALHRLRGLRGGLLRGEQPRRVGRAAGAARGARWPG